MRVHAPVVAVCKLEFGRLSRLKQNFPNPFYAFVVLIGIVFLVTASAYAVMVVNELKPGVPLAHPLFQLLREHGLTLFLVEVVALAICSIAAMVMEGQGKKPRPVGAIGIGNSPLPTTRLPEPEEPSPPANVGVNLHSPSDGPAN